MVYSAFNVLEMAIKSLILPEKYVYNAQTNGPSTKQAINAKDCPKTPISQPDKTISLNP